MDEVAGRVRLDRDPERLPAAAEVGELRVDVDLALLRADERVVDAEAALEHAGRALGAERGEPRGEDAAVRRPRRVHRLRRRRVVEVGEQAAGERARDAERARGRARRRRRRAARPRWSRRRSRRSRSGGSRARGTCPRRPSRSASRPRCRRRSPRAARGRSSRPPPPAATAAGQTTTLTCAIESECVSSKSSPWQSIAFAKAAFAAGSGAVVPDHRRLRLAAELRHRGAALGGDAERVRGEAAADACRGGGASRSRPRRPGSRRRRGSR